MMLSIFIGIEDIGPEGRLIFFTCDSQKQRGQSSSKFKLDGDSLYSIPIPSPKKETASRI
ncbi:MAG: hypothetical protein MUO82_12065 [Candidatus Thermoplasmatota archaeon]|nr:hypothetical protein [Candidatus Thermoplasmatota archaeon]